MLDKLGLANEGGGEEIVRDLALYRDKRSGRIALILILTYITLGSLFFAFYRGVGGRWGEGYCSFVYVETLLESAYNLTNRPSPRGLSRTSVHRLLTR